MLFQFDCCLPLSWCGRGILHAGHKAACYQVLIAAIVRVCRFYVMSLGNEVRLALCVAI